MIMADDRIELTCDHCHATQPIAVLHGDQYRAFNDADTLQAFIVEHIGCNPVSPALKFAGPAFRVTTEQGCCRCGIDRREVVRNVLGLPRKGCTNCDEWDDSTRVVDEDSDPGDRGLIPVEFCWPDGTVASRGFMAKEE